MTVYTVGSLFAGIGGFDYGLEQTGRYRTLWNVEYDPHAGEVLTRRFPDAARYQDVRDARDLPKVDVLTGGFPCQDLSLAGIGAGIGGARSGLWTEYARIIDEIQPAVVLIENVPALLIRGFEVVVADLVRLGYNLEWDCLPAAAFGAPHLRDRVWVVAHKHPEPVIFGQPAALFPLEPEGAADLEDTTTADYTDEDGVTATPAARWHRWPRAGWVTDDPGLVMPLEPLARVGDVKRNGGALIPTPTAGDGKGSGSRNLPGSRAHVGVSLTDYVRTGNSTTPRLWPTPRASTGGGEGTGEGTTYVRTPSQQDGTHGRYLQVEAFESVMPDADSEQRRAAGALNPEWVEWLMGFPVGWTDTKISNVDLRRIAWHDGEPDGVPRISDRKDQRKGRLTCLGNALIPPAAAYLGERALTILNERTPA